MTLTVVSWNIAKTHKSWHQLLEMDADLALLQEATPPPDDVTQRQQSRSGILDIGPRASWDSHSWNAQKALFDRWPMVVRLSDRVDVEWFRQVGPISEPAEKDQFAVSGIGTIAAARVTPREVSIEPFIAVSMYARWIKWQPSIKKSPTWKVGQPDSSAHRIISDLSAFIGYANPQRHRILAAGDLNIGYGDDVDPYWKARNQSVFERMSTIGLEFMGPHAPNGRQAETRNPGEPADSRNVVTFYPIGKNPATARNAQLDYAFASRGFHEDISVWAMNAVEEWGASDHCRVLIEIAGGTSRH